MHHTTKGNLEAAFAGESQAHMRYLIFADKAEKEGLANIARLFRAVAYAERVHATNHLRTLGGISTTAENLQEGIDGETYEVDEMYPSFKAVADLQEEKSAARTMLWAWEAEKIHAGMYGQARESALHGQDIALGDVWICDVCGHTVEGEPPDVCPVCQAKKERFIKF
jgi:rubrerythrin